MSMRFYYVSDVRPPTSLYCIPQMIYRVEGHSGMILRRETEVIGENTCPSATLSATNSIWADLGANPSLRCEWGRRLNLLKHGTANQTIKYVQYILFREIF
jgi:hypothetical protein